MKNELKAIIREVERQGKMTDFKKEILSDIAIITNVEVNGWKGYKIIGKNGYSFRFFYERIA